MEDLRAGFVAAAVAARWDLLLRWLASGSALGKGGLLW
jgi:hypothetical protein